MVIGLLGNWPDYGRFGPEVRFDSFGQLRGLISSKAFRASIRVGDYTVNCITFEQLNKLSFTRRVLLQNRDDRWSAQPLVCSVHFNQQL